jgi:hypothetical protein
LLTYFRARRWLRTGFLPSRGGWLEQSARLVAALEVIMDEEMANSNG